MLTRILDAIRMAVVTVANVVIAVITLPLRMLKRIFRGPRTVARRR